LVSGGYLSFRALRTWSLRVAAGAALCADGNSVRNSRISSPVERLPHTPLLTGSPVPSSCHRQRSQSSLPVLEQLRFAASATGSAHRRCVSSQVRTACVMAGVRPGKIHRHQRPKINTMLLHGIFLWYPAATYLSHSIPQWSCHVAAGAALCADGNSVRNSRISSPMERLSHTPLLTGSPVPFSCHRQRSQSSLPVLERWLLAVSATGGGRLHPISSQVIPLRVS